MSKELEEIKSIVAIHFGALGFLNPSENEQILKDRDKVLNYLSRFESIDNANPSEALEYIEILAGELGTSKDAKFAETRFPKMLITIQQALLKSQEPKQYLKWEDLEFKEEEQKMKVILNGSMHLLCYFRNMFGTSICIIDNTDITIRRENRDFFNDLHLEVVEDE